MGKAWEVRTHVCCVSLTRIRLYVIKPYILSNYNEPTLAPLQDAGRWTSLTRRPKPNFSANYTSLAWTDHGIDF